MCGSSLPPVLCTGFEPFGGSDRNPSSEAVLALPDRLCGCPLVRRVLPVDWEEAPRLLRQWIGELQPRLVLCVGLAGGSDRIRLERIGINLRGAIADNKGVLRPESPLEPGGPDGRFSTVDAAAALAALEREGIPASDSFSAGTYLCNAVLYTALGAVAPGTPAGFIHLPALPGMTHPKTGQAWPSLPPETQLRALETVLTVWLSR